MATEVILGSNAAGAQSLTANPGTQYSQPSLTASWTDAATSVDCTTGYLKFGAWDPASNFKMLVWDSGDNLIGVSDALNINPSGVFSTMTFSTPVTIVKGNTYRLGWISDGSSNTRPYQNGTGGSIHSDTSATYATPADWVENAEVSANTNLSAYLEADTTPSTPQNQVFYLKA